jgi:glutamate--cysteine ligase
MRKLVVGLKLGPIATAMFACSPFSAGRKNGLRSERAQVWLDTDADRCGLIPSLAGAKAPRYDDYVAWALEVPMYMFKRDGRVIANTGQRFRSFLEEGFDGHRATMGDWITHLNTLFPEARLQKTIELRCTDALPRRLAPAVPALWAGLLYDEVSLQGAYELAAELDVADVQAARPEIARCGIGATVAGRPAQELAVAMLELADAGLARRARMDESGRDERIHLAPIIALAQAGKCPADELLEGIDDAPDLRQAILERTLV